MKSASPPDIGDTCFIAGGSYVCRMVVDNIDDVWSYRGTNDRLTGGQIKGQTWWAIWVPENEVKV